MSSALLQPVGRLGMGTVPDASQAYQCHFCGNEAERWEIELVSAETADLNSQPARLTCSKTVA